MREFALIDRVRETCASARADVLLGIGDDAAVLAVPPGHDLLVSTDTLVAGVHFPHGTAASDIGWKSLAVNLSDIAAMAGTPAWASLALTLPAVDPDWLGEFLEGFRTLARRFDVALVGGDTTRGPLSITVTIQGVVPAGQAVRRSGARAGDMLVVFGDLGRAAAGLRWQLGRPEHARAAAPDDPEIAADLRALNRPEPLVALASILRGRATALIDVSDGLLADLGHVLRQSGVGVSLDLDRIPSWPGLRARFGADAAGALVLTGGDDYALLAAIPPNQVEAVLAGAQGLGIAAASIGSFASAPGIRLGCAGKPMPLPERSGYDHFQ